MFLSFDALAIETRMAQVALCDEMPICCRILFISDFEDTWRRNPHVFSRSGPFYGYN